ncbi:MAG: DUF58 domain-containing protein [Myxococcales bacterium]|nr:DUF58 domain-containing protein [Myxococcales bacterium]
MTLMVGFGAINTGNNLLYLMLGMMLGLIIVSGIMSESMLRYVRAKRLPVQPMFAGQDSPLEYRISNQKRLVPSFSIEVSEIETKETREFRLGKLTKAQEKAKKKAEAKQSDGAIVDPGIPCCLAAKVAAQTQAVRKGRVRLPKRGLYRYEGIQLATRFPFGFFKKSRRFDQALELLAFPRIVPLPPSLEPGVSPLGAFEHPRKGRGLEYLGMRDYQAGEDWRSIHWKVSARRGTPTVRENQSERARTVTIGVLNALTTGPSKEARECLERAIELAAAMAQEYLSQDYVVGLNTTTASVRPGSGAAQLNQILRALALLPTVESDTGRHFAGTWIGSAVVFQPAQGSASITRQPSLAVYSVDPKGGVTVA